MYVAGTKRNQAKRIRSGGRRGLRRAYGREMMAVDPERQEKRLGGRDGERTRLYDPSAE